MRFYLLLLFIAAALNCTAQDTTKHVRRSSISVTGGVNIVYPVTKQLISNTAMGPNAIWDLPIWDLTITPTSSASSYFSFTYNYRFHQRRHHYYGLHAGFTYLQYRYKMNAQGYVWSDGYDSGTYKAQISINAAELYVGISMDHQLLHHVSWHNELDIMQGYYNNSSFSVSTNAPFEEALTNGYYTTNTYTYLFYKTGLNIKLSENISVMPEIAIPLFDIGFLFENQGPVVTLPTFPYPKMGAPEPIYRSIRTGITVTYNLTKKSHH